MIMPSARADAGATIDVSAVVQGGFSLEDHLASGPAVPRIRSRSWSVVVLQQGPSTLPESRALLVRDATRMAAEIRAVGARPALLMVWGIPGQRQEDVDASYRAWLGTAELNDVVVSLRRETDALGARLQNAERTLRSEIGARDMPNEPPPHY